MFAFRSLQKSQSLRCSVPRQSFSTFFPFNSLNNSTNTSTNTTSSTEQSQNSMPHFSTKASSGKVKTISKKDIAEEIASTHDMSVAASKRVLDTALDTIVESVLEGKSVRIKGFGSFDSYMSQERMGRNPSSGEQILIPSKRRIRFKAGASFKESE